MNPTCNLVAERVALGEPLDELADHAASCARCRRVVALPAELGATHRDADPGIGFAARVTAGAQQRIAVRRRRRVAVGLAAAVAAGALGVFVVTREPAPQVAVTPAREPAPATEPKPHDPGHEPGNLDDDVAALVHLANIDHARHLSADWKSIAKPLAPYRALVKGVTP